MILTMLKMRTGCFFPLRSLSGRLVLSKKQDSIKLSPLQHTAFNYYPEPLLKKGRFSRSKKSLF